MKERRIIIGHRIEIFGKTIIRIPIKKTTPRAN